MPIYPYHCSSCGQEHEQLHKMDEEPDPCELCGASTDNLERLVTAASFRFERGVGWDGWDKMPGQPGMISRVVDSSKHIDDPGSHKNPGSRKA